MYLVSTHTSVNRCVHKFKLKCMNSVKLYIRICIEIVIHNTNFSVSFNVFKVAVLDVHMMIVKQLNENRKKYIFFLQTE